MQVEFGVRVGSALRQRFIALEGLVDVQCLNDLTLGDGCFLKIYMSFDFCTQGEVYIAQKGYICSLSQTVLLFGCSQCALGN